MGHHGHDHGPSTGRALWISLLLTLVLGVIQIGGAVAFDSLALVSDAVHNLSDALAVLLAVGAAWLAGLPPRGAPFEADAPPRRAYSSGVSTSRNAPSSATSRIRMPPSQVARRSTRFAPEWRRAFASASCVTWYTASRCSSVRSGRPSATSVLVYIEERPRNSSSSCRRIEGTSPSVRSSGRFIT